MSSYATFKTVSKATRGWSVEGADIIANYNLLYKWLRTGSLLHRNFCRIEIPVFPKSQSP